MAEILKWSAIVFAIIFFIVSIVMTVMYFKKDSGSKVTKINLVYSQASNPKLKDSSVTIDSYLVEKDTGEIYLVIPGIGTQNKFKWLKLASSATNPTEIKSNTIEALKGYTVQTNPSQLPGYFNNCAKFQYTEWTLSNGVLNCKPFVYSATTRVPQEIDLKDCGGASINVGAEITNGFGTNVIKLVKA